MGDKIDFELLISFCALLVAALSIYFTWTGLRDQRKHNRLTVKPIPYIAERFLPRRLSVEFQNNGVGPMQIISCQVRNRENPSETSDHLHSLMPPIAAELQWDDYVVSIGNRWLKAGKHLSLLELKIPEHADPDMVDRLNNYRKAVSKVLATLEIEIEYTDVYGTEFATHVKSLEWFKNFEPKPDQTLGK